MMLAVCFVAVCAGGLFLFSGRYKPCISDRPADLIAEDLIGQYASSSGGQLILDGGGRLRATGIVFDRMSGPVILEGAGSWSLLPEADSQGDVRLTFPDASFNPTIRVSGTRAEPLLYWYVGDADACRLERLERS